MDEKSKFDLEIAKVELDERPRLLSPGDVGYLWRSMDLEKADPGALFMVSVLGQPPFPRKVVERINIAANEIEVKLLTNYDDGAKLFEIWRSTGAPILLYEVEDKQELLKVERKMLDLRLEYARIYTNAKRNAIFGIEFFAPKYQVEKVVEDLAEFKDR